MILGQLVDGRPAQGVELLRPRHGVEKSVVHDANVRQYLRYARHLHTADSVEVAFSVELDLAGHSPLGFSSKDSIEAIANVLATGHKSSARETAGFSHAEE